MDFRQFTEGACGQSNPNEELASHVTGDNAHRDTINYIQSTSSNELETPMAPQNFRMNELMQEIQNMERQNVASTDSWADEYRNQVDQSNAYESIPPGQEANWFTTTTSQHTDLSNPQLLENLRYITTHGVFPPNEQNYAYASTSTCDRNQMLDLEMFNLNEERPICNMQSEADSEELVEDTEETQKSIFESDGVKVQPQENEPEPNKESRFIYFNGLCTEDVHQADTQDVAWTNSENFVRLLTNYIKTYQRRDFDLNIETEYEFSENNPYDSTIRESHTRGLWYFENHHPLHTILYFEAAVRANHNDSQSWKYLIDVLIYNGQYYDAYCLAKKNLHQNLNYFSMVIYNFLFDEQYYYQGCQAILNWLRSHSDYYDVIPPNYMMEDKTSSLVEEERVADLKAMLIKVAHRKSDYHVLIALSKLHEISRDYKQANDFIISAIRTKTTSPWKDWINILYNLIRDNEPTQALFIVESLNKQRTSYSCRINCQNINGIVNMYLGNYIKAVQFFLATLDRLIVWKTSQVCDLQKDTVWSELRLCIELMNRKDLLHLVDEINFKKLCEEFNYKPIV